jgi:hypothetical protein
MRGEWPGETYFPFSLRKGGREEQRLAGSSGKLGLRVTSVGKYA